jgi:hypothetical protein
MERSALRETGHSEAYGRKPAIFKFDNNQIAILNY